MTRRRDAIMPDAPLLAVPPRERVSTPAAGSGSACAVSSWRYADPRVRGTLLFAELPGLALGHVRADAHRVDYDPQLSTATGEAQLHVLFQLSGRCVLESGHDCLKLPSGTFVFIAANRRYAISSDQRSERVVMLIARERVGEERFLLELDARVQYASSGVGRVLFATVASVVEEVQNISAAYAPVLVEQLAELLRASGREGMRVPQVDDPRRQRIEAYVSEHVRDPTLSLARIAAALRCSLRYLNRVYSRKGESLMEYVYRLRVEGVRQDLLDPAHRHRSITELALDWGFSCGAHLSRRFRRRYKVTPREVRQRGLRRKDPV